MRTAWITGLVAWALAGAFVGSSADAPVTRSPVRPWEPATGIVTPNPAACRVAPRTYVELAALFATPAGTPPAVPEPIPTVGSAMADAPFVDPATLRAVIGLVDELVACANAGDAPRALALFTDDAVRAELRRHRTDPASRAAGLRAPTPRPTELRAAYQVALAYAVPGGAGFPVFVSIADPTCTAGERAWIGVAGYVRWEAGRYRWDTASPVCGLFDA